MADDAHAPSQPVSDRSLEQRFSELLSRLELVQRQVDVLSKFRMDVGDILDGIDLRIEQNTSGILSDRQYIQRLEQAIRDLVTAELAAAPDAPSVPRGGEDFRRAVAQAEARHAKRRRREDCHLRVVKGSALAALAVLWHWSPKKTAIGVGLAALGIGTTVMPGRIMAVPSPAMNPPHAVSGHQAQPHARRGAPGAVTVVHHRRCHDREGDAVLVLLADERSVCRDRDGAADALAAQKAVPASSPSPAASPASPSPSPGVTPSPSPSVTPSPSPTCTAAPGTAPQVSGNSGTGNGQ